MKKKKYKTVVSSNIYKLDGWVTLLVRLSHFGLQAHFSYVRIKPRHRSTMIAGAAKVPVTGAELGMLLQNAMFLLRYRNSDQLYPSLEDWI